MPLSIIMHIQLTITGHISYSRDQGTCHCPIYESERLNKNIPRQIGHWTSLRIFASSMYTYLQAKQENEHKIYINSIERTIQYGAGAYTHTYQFGC
jgi:hypothetical protein